MVWIIPTMRFSSETKLVGGRRFGTGAAPLVSMPPSFTHPTHQICYDDVSQVYLQVGPGEANLDLASALEFINTVGYTSAFQRLRTQEQLGYIVYTQLERGPPGKVTPYDLDGGAGMHPGGPLAWSVVIQSPDKTPAELEERIEAWMSDFRGELADMTHEVFAATVASMVSRFEVAIEAVVRVFLCKRNFEM